MYVLHSAVPPALTIQEIEDETNKDQELKELRKLIITAKYLPKNLGYYNRLFHELSVTEEGIVLRNHRIIIPKSLRKRVVELVHVGHQGIVKTKRLIRSRVWFYGIDNMVEKQVHGCKECQTNCDREVVCRVTFSDLWTMDGRTLQSGAS
jgi:hypothetical protein